METNSSDAQNISADSHLLDSDKDGSGTGQSHAEGSDILQEKQGENTSQDAEVVHDHEDGKKDENQGNEEDGEDEDEEEEDEDEEDDDEDEYENGRNADQDGLFSSGGSMSSMVSGMSSRLKGILANLRAFEDPSLQLIALQDLAVLLSVSTEDNLSGYINLDTFIKELVTLLRGTGDGDDNPDIMLLACRCLSNLMEAMPNSVGNVYYGGAIPVLCSKLIEIQYIDLAEQSLTTLEKISTEYPQAVVKEGGLGAVLMYLDFFSTNVQRTAVKTAANCCRGISQEYIGMVQDILPNLENIMQYSDQKIVEHACLCFVRLADSFKSNAAHLQTIITENILRAVLSILSPNANVVVGPSVYTKLLHFLSTVAEHSPVLGFALLEMDIVDTLFLVLTGTHVPKSTTENEHLMAIPDDVGARPKEQVSEIIGIITELLPTVPKDDPLFDTDYRHASLQRKEQDKSKQEQQTEDVEMTTAPSETPTDKRRELLESHPERVQRLSMILVPTLIQVYVTTGHLKIRQRAIQALVKLVYFTSEVSLKTVLKDVGLASFIAVVFSQQEHQSLVIGALQMSYILMTKLPSLYRFHFERQGVTFEITKIAYTGAEQSLSKYVKNIQAAMDRSAKVKSQTTDGVAATADTETVQNASELEGSTSETQDPTPDSTPDSAPETTPDPTPDPIPDPTPDSNSNPTSDPTPDATPDSTSGSTSEPAPDPVIVKEASLALVSAIQLLLKTMAEWQVMANRSDQEQTMEQQLDTMEKELQEAWTRSGLPGQNGESVVFLTKTYDSALEQLRSLRRVIKLGSCTAILSRKDDKGLGSGPAKEWAFERARIVLDMVQLASTTSDAGASQGVSALADLKRMSEGLRGSPTVVSKTITELSQYFGRLGVTGISSFEFLNSGLALALLEYLTDMKDATCSSQEDRARTFVQEFMVSSQSDTTKSATPLSSLVKKLQETLTRMETFEVEVAQTSLGESRNNSSSSLATQVRLRLSPDEGTEVPPGFQNLVVSIHAIATFRTLDEYLRPRLRPKLPQADKEVGRKTTGTSNNNNGDSKGSRDTASKEQGAGTDTKAKHSPPVTRRSSRLQKRSNGTEEKTTNGAGVKSKVVKGTKELDSNHSEESHGDTDGDVEEMDCDLESKTSATGTQGIETSSIDMDSDVKPKVNTNTNAESQSDRSADDNGHCLEKLETSTHPRKTRGTDNPSADSSPSWHIQFSLHGTPISTDMTVYGAIHAYERIHGKGSSQRIQFASTYPIKYKRVESPPPEQSALHANSQSSSEVDLTFTAQMPKELPQNADYAPILGLLRVLHGLNDDWRRFCTSDDQISQSSVQRLEHREFFNSKIAAKVNRQLEEPLIVASSCLPDWTIGLVTGFPFLFPFETRYTYLQSTAFGFSRSIMRWQNQQQRGGHGDQRDDSQTFLGRIQRQKVRISRQKALESAVRVMELYGANQAMLEVEYFEEVGTGLGPTLEFYSLVSKEFCKKSLKLWRDADSQSPSEYVLAPRGLYPRPMVPSKGHSENEEKILKLFRSLGQFIAKAMLDSRIIDVPLSTLFVSQMLGRNLKPRLQLVSHIDPDLARSLQKLQEFVTEKKRVYSLNLPSKEREIALKNIELHGSTLEDMDLDFTLVGYPEIELKAGGDKVPVTIYNVEEYISSVVDMTVGRGIEAQVAAFRSGFNCVFSIQDLRGFRPEELVNLFGSGEEDWSNETLVDVVKADHGFQSESRAFRNLLEVMSEFSKEERRQFLQFITGSPKLPIGGFKNLHPPFTVVCRPFEAPLKADDYLPSVMTCANYLKMPDYSSKEVTVAKFRIAYMEGQGSFHLS
ncbi:Ubiquitin fusion degradation protein 4 [Mortierella sp. GBA43]|nr:Ubiquitin fusion degradation protein 4 [Mortierella sp. GBA43]